ncbi:heavy-metal-associated domain-containing protein [Pedobacter nototheniae]|uniref:heavy-metal-associated domain-containing protein n=1 Tax=Pedobacter nototheniae TaxID=2488994 RepID=UPI0010387F82|nr:MULTISPECIES: hypothetical protein [Pedobacter]
METLKFKTNIKCGGCIATVTPFMDKLTNIESWEVDTQNPDKVMTVKVEDGADAKSITNAVEEAGYLIEKI